MRHLLLRLVRASVVQSRAAQYTVHSNSMNRSPRPGVQLNRPRNTAHPAQTKSPPLHAWHMSQHSNAADGPQLQPITRQQHQPGRVYLEPLLPTGSQSGIPGVHAQHQSNSHGMSHGKQDQLQFLVQSAQGQGLQHVNEPADVQQSASALQPVNSSAHSAALQLGEVPPAWCLHADQATSATASVQPDSLAHLSGQQNAQSWRHDTELLLGSSAIQQAALMPGMPIQNRPLLEHVTQMQNDWQPQPVWVRALLQQQTSMAAILQQLGLEIRAIRSDVSELQALQALDVGKALLKPLN